MSQTILEKNIIDTLGLSTLTDAEHLAFVKKAGDTVLELALVRLVKGLSDEQHASLDHYLATDPDQDPLIKHLIEHYSQFTVLLEGVIIEFKEDAIAVLGE